jgi:hypothetical protein
MEVIRQPMFWIGIAQMSALYPFLNWAAPRESEDAPAARAAKALLAVLGSVLILAGPGWLLGQLPVNPTTAGRPWFFGLAASGLLLMVRDRARRWRGRQIISGPLATGRCPYCRHHPGIWRVLSAPPAQPFPCRHRGKLVCCSERRVMTMFALWLLPVAIWVVATRGETRVHLVQNVLAIAAAVMLAIYPFIAEIGGAENE